MRFLILDTCPAIKITLPSQTNINSPYSNRFRGKPAITKFD